VNCGPVSERGDEIIDLHRQIDAKNKLLMEMANTDPLTACQTGARSKNGRRNYGARRVTDSSLVVHTDVDCFKDINDGYGHDAGDLVLKNSRKF